MVSFYSQALVFSQSRNGIFFASCLNISLEKHVLSAHFQWVFLLSNLNLDHVMTYNVDFPAEKGSNRSPAAFWCFGGKETVS